MTMAGITCHLEVSYKLPDWVYQAVGRSLVNIDCQVSVGNEIEWIVGVVSELNEWFRFVTGKNQVNPVHITKSNARLESTAASNIETALLTEHEKVVVFIANDYNDFALRHVVNLVDERLTYTTALEGYGVRPKGGLVFLRVRLRTSIRRGLLIEFVSVKH